jgi:hypothetical protein
VHQQEHPFYIVLPAIFNDVKNQATVVMPEPDDQL